jgi:plasmid stabilization system protein ParE
MGFHVELSPQALADLDSIAGDIAGRGSPGSAARWFDGLIAAIRTLAEMPHRCPLAAEDADLQAGVRLLLHGRRNRCYKIFYAIHEPAKTVRVFHIRHWARKPAAADELQRMAGSGSGQRPEI